MPDHAGRYAWSRLWVCLITWVGVADHMGGCGWSHGWVWMVTWVGVTDHVGGCGWVMCVVEKRKFVGGGGLSSGGWEVSSGR